MAASSIAAASLGYSVYEGYQASKKPKLPALPTLPPIGGDPAIVAAQAGTAQAQSNIAKKRRLAGSQSSTLLTGPQGVSAPPPSSKTLLGS